MHPHARLITAFYEAFGRRDADGMAALYHRDAVFSDPVFGQLSGEQARQMWRMLCARGKDLRIGYREVHANATEGSAEWEARYHFSPTGRPVHNVIRARFAFRDGRIIRHIDEFDLYRWARQAFGWKGLLIGWSGPAQDRIRMRAREGLDTFIRTTPPGFPLRTT